MVPKHQGLKRINHNILRDFSFSRTFGSASLPGLPPGGLGRKPLAVKDQSTSNFCTAFGVSSASEYQEGVVLSPEYQTAKEGEVAGTPILQGTDPKTAMKSALAYGSLPQAASPFSFQVDGWTMPADWTKWSDTADRIAADHKKQGYFRVAHGWPADFDVFDSIRLALWQSRLDNAVVMAYGKWYNSFNSPQNGIVAGADWEFSRHAYLYIDWTTINGVEYVVAQLSQGPSFGNGGLLYFDRPTVNKIWGNFFNQLIQGVGMYMFKDVPTVVKKII